MPDDRPRILGLASRRLLALAVLATTSAIAVCALLASLEELIQTPPFWAVAWSFLMAVEFAYVILLVVIAVGLPTIGALASRRRCPPALLRAGLVLTSTGVGLVLAELVSTHWLARSRGSLVPVGGLSRGMQVDSQTLWPPLSKEDVTLPENLPPRSDDQTIELAVLGESSAQGVPYHAWVSIGQMVAWKLEEAIPGRRVRIQTLANSGDTLELQHQRLAMIPRRPDLLIVYCGHNEFGSRLNGSRLAVPYDDDLRPAAWRMVLDAAEALSATCELIRRAIERCRLEVPPSGRRELVDAPAFTPREHDLLLADYRRRLDAILDYTSRIHALAIVIVPPGNDADFEPNRSFLPHSTPRGQREEFARDFMRARRLESIDLASAIVAYRGLIARQPGFAESYYRLGVLLSLAGSREDSYRAFIAARDRDGYPVRCPSEFQDVCRDVARRHEAILIDGQAELHAIGRHGRLDDELFQDAMHPSLRGQIALAQAVLSKLRDRQAFGWSSKVAAPPIDPSECVKRFRIGRSAWKDLCLWGIHFGTYAQGLRYDPATRLQRKQACATAHDQLVAGASVESLGLPNLGIPRPVPTR